MSALKVNKGIPKPESVNASALDRLRGLRRPKLDAQAYYEGIRRGDRGLLGQAITLVESTLPEHASLAARIVELCLPHTGHSIRVGITGVPGVGKSTFIESFGLMLCQQGRQLAVLAIDPSSEKTRGSILGDKTRMQDLSRHPAAFIRPSPSAGSLGGVARKTRESVILCEAAGFDTLFIETVGVGQSETTVHSMVDFFLLLMLAGAGDELQGIKRGIMEMADAVVINKADGDNERKARRARLEYLNALHLFPPPESGVRVEVLTASALRGLGLAEVWQTIERYRQHVQESGYFDLRRGRQERARLRESLDHALLSHFYQDPRMGGRLLDMERRVLEAKVTPFEAARVLLDEYLAPFRNTQS